MDCGRCGYEDDDAAQFTRIAVFQAPEPSREEVAELLTSPGLLVCRDCQSEYLEWLTVTAEEEARAD